LNERIFFIFPLIYKLKVFIMNKKFLSVALFGALLATTTGTFTSCKDYDDDIKGLQEQIDKKGATMETIANQLKTLESALDAAKTTADAAKDAAAKAQAAADAAKSAGDAALAKAKEAEAKAQTAIAAAATAKTEAIEAAKAEIATLKTLLEEKIAGKVSQDVYDAAVAALGGRIDGIQEGLNTLKTGAVAKNTKDIADIFKLIGTSTALEQDLLTQIKALQAYQELSEGMFEEQGGKLEQLRADLGTAEGKIDKLWKEIFTEGTGLKALITTLRQDFNALKERVERELPQIQEELTNIKNDITGINRKISDEIMPDLAMLHTLITSRLTSIKFAPSYFADGIEAIKFNSLNYDAMPANENAEIPGVYKHSTANLATASYHFNPVSFKLKNADYQYIDRRAELGTFFQPVIGKGRALNTSSLVEIEGEPVLNPVTGTVDFQLRRLNAWSNMLPNNNNDNDWNKINIIALQAMLKGEAIDKEETDVIITSPYVAVKDFILSKEDVRIADKETLEEGEEAHYALTFNACKNEEARYKMAYNKTFDLKELVATCFANGNHEEFPVADYKLSYRFAVASSAYNISSGNTQTNQQKWIKCNDAEKGLFQAEGFNKEAIGRTPILKVELVDEAGRVVRRGFVKVEIVAEKVADMYIGDGISYANIVYQCADTQTKKYEISEDYMRENLYRVITNGTTTSMSHEEFWSLYDFEKAEVTKNGKIANITKPQLVDGPSTTGTATKKVTWQFKHGEVGAIGTGGANLVATLVVKNKLASSEYPQRVFFKFKVKVVLPQFTLNKKENDLYWEKDGDTYVAYRVNVAVPQTPESPAEQCVFKRSISEAYSTYQVNMPAGTCTEDKYEIIRTYNNGTPTSTVMAGVKLDGNIISLDKSNDKVKKALNSSKGLQAVVAHKYKLNSGDVITVNEFMVTFIRPVNLNMPGGVEVTDAVDGGDVADFQHNGLLTDWRGEPIVAPYWEKLNKTVGFWENTYVPQYALTEGYYKVVKEAEFSVETGTVSFTAGVNLTMYTGHATYKIKKIGGLIVWGNTFYVNEPKLTKDAVDADLEAQVQSFIGQHNLYSNYEKVGETEYTEVKILEGQEVEYTYIKDIKYVPAEYEWVPGEWTEVPHTPTAMPEYDGTTNGQTSGDWKWVIKTEITDNWVAGKYWNFYGPFTDVKLDVTKATTSLEYNNHQLPSGATLVQVGNTVRYENVGSPVGYKYTITIPATVTYGWGTTSAKLVITVNPKK